MITDKQTEIIYFSHLLPKKFKSFWKRFETILLQEKISFDLIFNTSDIWCRDYMPVQVSQSKCIRFEYFPDYLLSPQHIHSLTNNKEVETNDDFNIADSPLVIDGGNLVYSDNFLITTDKIFRDNKQFAKHKVIAELKKNLGVKEIFVIPQLPDDYTGHADGMVRFLDDKRLLVADYSNESRAWRKKFQSTALQEQFELIKFPNYPSDIKNKNGDITAIGNYINFIQVGKKVFFPQFEIPEDKYALKMASEILYPLKVIPVKCREIAMEGGALHCISWNAKLLKQMNLRKEIKLKKISTSKDVLRYVYDNISFYLSYYDFEIIEDAFLTAWSVFYGQVVGDADLKGLTYRYIEAILNEENLIPQQYVDRVFKLMLDFAEKTGSYYNDFTAN